MAITKQEYTLADLIKLPPDGHIYEVLGGELLALSSPNRNHVFIVGELSRLFQAATDAGFGYGVSTGFAVAFDFAERGLGARFATHPDLFFVRQERRAIFGFHCLTEAPDLVVEIRSPNNTRQEMQRKFDIHQTYGVQFYWIVDPERRTIAQYTLAAGRYAEPTILHTGHVLTCPLFPGLELEVARVFANVVPDPDRTPQSADE